MIPLRLWRKWRLRQTDKLTTLVVKAAGKIRLISFQKEESLFDEESALKRTDAVLEIADADISEILIDKEQRNLYLVHNDGNLSFFDISDKSQPVIKQHLNVVAAGQKITSITFLNGDLSLLIGDSSGLGCTVEHGSGRVKIEARCKKSGYLKSLTAVSLRLTLSSAAKAL